MFGSMLMAMFSLCYTTAPLTFVLPWPAYFAHINPIEHLRIILGTIVRAAEIVQIQTYPLPRQDFLVLNGARNLIRSTDSSRLCEAVHAN